jgi:two-component system chemotaxis sensor kinase CheA
VRVGEEDLIMSEHVPAAPVAAARGPAPGLSIHHKLIGLIVVLVVAIVGFLAVYFPARQIEALTDGLTAKASTYGALVSRQVQSAIAFDDRETAREVFAAIAADHDVAGLALYTQAGTVLHQHGTLGAWAAPTLRAGAAVDVRVSDNHIAVIAPVVSLEGPRGTLVLEISTARLAAGRRQVTLAAVAVGGAALLFGVLAGWWIARSLARRLRAIAGVATAVAAGDLDQQPVSDGSGDEIGTLAFAFNAMLARIKGLIASIEDMARKEQERLGNLVAERTAQLDRRNADMRLVLDNVEQGLFTVDVAGRIEGEQSAAVGRLLGSPPPSGLLADYVAQFAPDIAPWFAVCWDAVASDTLPLELALDQLPRRVRAGDRHLDLAFQPLVGQPGDTPRFLVVVSDVTSAIARQAAERDESESTALLSRLMRDRAGFLAFHRETSELVAAIATTTDGVALGRFVHTLKGNAGIYGLGSIADLCHDIEDRLAEGGVTLPLGAEALAERWRFTNRKLDGLLTDGGDRLEIHAGDHRALLEAIARGEAHARLRAIAEAWRHEPVAVRLERVADHARGLAARLQKGHVDVRVEANHLRLPDAPLADFWSTFVHAVRNAVDHGVEDLEERRAAGKGDTALLSLRARCDGDRFVVEIEDGGRGIDWDRLAAVARAAGRRAETHDELVEALFSDGVSTRSEVTEMSGRGVGLAAVRGACVATGGEVSVHSERGRGTRFRFAWPLSLVAPAHDVVYQAAV